MCARGFSLIELLVVILIIGILAAVGIPRVLRVEVAPAQTMVATLNMLVATAQDDAQRAQEVRRVFVDLTDRRATVQTADGEQLGRAALLPAQVAIDDVVINGESQFGGLGTKKSFYFLIHSDGSTQQVHITLTDDERRSYDLDLNPFVGAFRVR